MFGPFRGRHEAVAAVHILQVERLLKLSRHWQLCEDPRGLLVG